jgi:hypothetical protein
VSPQCFRLCALMGLCATRARVLAALTPSCAQHQRWRPWSSRC